MNAATCLDNVMPEAHHHHYREFGLTTAPQIRVQEFLDLRSTQFSPSGMDDQEERVLSSTMVWKTSFITGKERTM
ncbi:hypothetical protein ANCDUO_09754 [Ancylostoma duodenale]|uniref:Uncharacterized protein n=1 Tax=Ancylostoma duodenale TaxID=51022 RepID=A0A0C2DC38_9BILA|nr:hypothetical protein ANCDUO_09754 [Ancylostoma duodenale]